MTLLRALVGVLCLVVAAQGQAPAAVGDASAAQAPAAAAVASQAPATADGSLVAPAPVTAAANALPPAAAPVASLVAPAPAAGSPLLAPATAPATDSALLAPAPAPAADSSVAAAAPAPSAAAAVLPAPAVAGAGSQQQPAPAPGPAADMPLVTANGVFTTTAARAFTNATTILLQGLTSTTAWLQYGSAVRAGTLSQADFTGSRFTTNGTWLDGLAQAVLYGQLAGQPSSVALLLANPQLAPDGSLSMQYQLADNATLPLAGGVVNDVLAAASAGVGNQAQPLSAGQVTQAELTNVTLLTDAVDIPGYLQPVGQLRVIRIPLGGSAYNRGFYRGEASRSANINGSFGRKR